MNINFLPQSPIVLNPEIFGLSINGLQLLLLNICGDYAVEDKIAFNGNKTFGVSFCPQKYKNLLHRMYSSMMYVYIFLNKSNILVYHTVAYGGRFCRVFTRLAACPKLWRFTSRGGCRLYHKPSEHLNRLTVDHNHQTTRSTYARTSTAWDTNKNWLISFLVTKSFQLNSLIRNK